MNRDDQSNDHVQISRGSCLVDGCSCKDARIVSRRRAAYFAARARQAGQTAHRVIAVEPGWWLPGSARRVDVDPRPVLASAQWPTWRLTDLRLSVAATD